MLGLGAWQAVEIFKNFSEQWYWLIVATVYTITINETFTHRTCGHKMFDVNVKSIWYKILTFLSSVDQAHGPVRTHAIWHLSHHKYADQGNFDNVNAKVFWYGDAWILPFGFLGKKADIPDKTELIGRAHNTFREIIEDPWTMFCEKHIISISVLSQLVLYFACPTILFKVLLLGRFIMTVGMIGAGIAHLQRIPLTYRNFNTPDMSNNNLILHYLFLGIFGGLLQNNHHGKPNALNMGAKWWEIDTSTPIAYLLKFLMEKKKIVR